VTLPDGRTQEVSAPESGLATLTVEGDGEYGLRPTILDSRPWTRLVVTVFRMATSGAPTQEIGSIEVRTGAPAVQTETSPAFRIAVTRVDEPGQRTS